MNKWIYVCLAVGLLLLAAPAGALIPDNITLSTDTLWLTAGSGGTSTVTVNVTNGSDATSVPGAAVYLAVDGAYGSISPARVVTGSDGTATATFRHGTRSGTATITASVPHEELTEPLTGSVEQQIDHAAPHKIANLWYKSEVTAGETTEIAVRMVDRYGNVVDGRNVAEEVTFRVGLPAGFIGGTDEISVPVDGAGNATATLRLDTVAGENLVSIYPPAPIRSDMISITGVGGLPADITRTVSPDISVPADGETTISLVYTLLDRYGNPTAGQGLWVNATVKRVNLPDELQSRLVYSNRDGLAMIAYGPEESVGFASITATAAANSSVTVTTQLEFTSTDPVNMLLTASPQSMPSRDVRLGFTSELRAKVMDIKGNPVKNQTVTFKIVSNSFAPYNQTVAPKLEGGSVPVTTTTNDDGYAIVKFTPGNFTTDKNALGWSNTSTADATVRATWGNVSRDIVLTWMNYPYLSVETEVYPETVAVNDTVDVTIRLRGDGYALRPDPIDVVLVIDTSGSMTGTDVSPTRMAAAQEAAKDFVNQMDLTADGDRVALVSFAFGADLKQGLTNDSSAIKGAITDLKPDGATNMRLAYYTAIKHLKENGRPEAVKAVVLMGDGDWNYHGSPLAKGTGYADNNRYLTSDWYSSPYYAPLSAYRWSGSEYSFSSERYEWYSSLPAPKGTTPKTQKLDKGVWYDTWNGNKKVPSHTPTSSISIDGQLTNQNMSIYATSGDETERVKIYSIGFASKLNSNVERDLTILSEATGGKYVWAKDEAALKKVYTEIAGELKTEAGVDTSMNLVFKDVEVNGTLESGAEVFDYVYENWESTVIKSWIDNTTPAYEIVPRYTRNDTQNWTSTIPHLPFDIGTVHLYQTWETTFRLKVLMDGNINVFGPGSTISFNNGTDTLELPDTFITALPDLNNTGITSAWLEVALDQPVPPAGQDIFTNTVPLSWNVTYNGTRDIDKALAYSNNNGLSWTVFWKKTVDNLTTQGAALMDVSNLPAGEYHIRLTASAADAPEAVDTTSVPILIGSASRAYIEIR